MIDKIQPDEIGEVLVNVGELVADEEWQITNDSEHSLQEDYSVPEREVDLEQIEIERRENTNLWVLEWMHNLETDKREAQNIQQVDVSSMKHVKTGNPLFGWTATDRSQEIPPDNLNPTPSTINIFVRGVRVGLTHTKNLMIKKLRGVRETNGLELDQEDKVWIYFIASVFQSASWKIRRYVSLFEFILFIHYTLNFTYKPKTTLLLAFLPDHRVFDG